MQERDCMFYRPVATLNVVPYQFLEFGTTLNIHSHRLPQFHRLSAATVGRGTALTNGRIQTHINQQGRSS
jgi:hypothetical protein